VVVACLSPASNSAEHTLNTLRYASRIKEQKASGGNGSDKALNGGVALPGGGRNKPRSVSVADQLAAEMAEKENEERIANQKCLTPPTPMRPPAVDALLNLKYKNKGKAKPKPKVTKQKWSLGDAVDDGEQRGGWLYQQPGQSDADSFSAGLADEARKNAARRLEAREAHEEGGGCNPHSRFGQTQETTAIRNHEEVIAARCHSEKATLEQHNTSLVEMDRLRTEEQNLLGWAVSQQEAGELDTVEYTTRMASLLSQRAALDAKLKQQLQRLQHEVDAEEKAALQIEQLLNR